MNTHEVVDEEADGKCLARSTGLTVVQQQIHACQHMKSKFDPSCKTHAAHEHFIHTTQALWLAAMNLLQCLILNAAAFS